MVRKCWKVTICGEDAVFRHYNVHLVTNFLPVVHLRHYHVICEQPLATAAIAGIGSQANCRPSWDILR